MGIEGQRADLPGWRLSLVAYRVARGTDSVMLLRSVLPHLRDGLHVLLV